MTFVVRVVPAAPDASERAECEAGRQLRCCLRRSGPDEPSVLITHESRPLGTPWGEAGPVFVHTTGCPGWPGEADTVPDWWDAKDLVLRGYARDGSMHHAAHRLVRAGEGVGLALAAVLEDDLVAEVDVHNLLAQCFVARVVRG